MTDVLVLGAGLAGLAAARDLVEGGAGRRSCWRRASRVGGRVEQLRVDDGRPAQLGGEVVGEFHTAYLRLVEELGLTLEPSYVAVAGDTTYDLFEGVERGDRCPFRDGAERGRLRAGRAALRPSSRYGRPGRPVVAPRRLAARRRLGRCVAALGRRAAGVDPAPRTAALALADGSIERTSLLAELRKSAAAATEGFYSYELWESMQVAEGSAEVAERMAAELGDRVRLEEVVTASRWRACGAACASPRAKN